MRILENVFQPHINRLTDENNELNAKLACRGLKDTKILLLDESCSAESLSPCWQMLQTSNGAALLFNNPLSMACPPIVFTPNRASVSELELQFAAAGIAEKSKLLVCIVNSDSPVDGYDVVEWVDGSLINCEAKNSTFAQMNAQIECTSVELANQLSEKNFLVVDVREPFESATSHLDEILIDLLGRRTTKKLATTRLSHLSFEIIPLSRLPQFIIDCMNNAIKQDILCVCRSGQRSLQAAQLLRRTASCNAISLRGGLAALLAPTTSLSNAQKVEIRPSK